MKKILLTLLLLILFIPGVNAEELPTVPYEGMGFANSINKNLLKPGWGIASYYNGFQTYSGSNPILNNFIPVSGGTTYYYSSNFSKYCTFLEFNSELKYIHQHQKWNNSSFKTLSTTKYLNFSCPSSAEDMSSPDYWFQIEEGSSATEYIPYEEKATEPEKPVIIPDVTLDNFYELCINKLIQLSDFTIENKFTLSAFGIIIFFTIVGLFIHLFKGGTRQ